MSVNVVYSRLLESVSSVLLGKRDRIEVVLATLLAGGHALIEDVPGVGKTVLARVLARSLDATFSRIQCTPDLLPSDVTGSSIYNPKELAFEFREGPVFAQVVLADEVNRATPRTQSALLEAMEEGQVSADGRSMDLPTPFFLIATQNPIEMAGTFPLPEAQLDRFMVQLSLGYPDDVAEVEMMLARRDGRPLEDVSAVASVPELLESRDLVRKVFVHPVVAEYIQRLAAGTRAHEHAAFGSSPRGTLALMKLAQALAFIRGESFVTPDHVKELASSALAHRVVVKPRSRVQGVTGAQIVTNVLGAVDAPVDVAPDDSANAEA